jgi:hypothetical protein
MVEVASGRQKIVDRARLKSTSEVAGGAVQQELPPLAGEGWGEGYRELSRPAMSAKKP